MLDIDVASTCIICFVGVIPVDLIRINDVVDNFGISSRTLRYYEEVGLLWSSHPDNKTQ
jgi:hypothetical protein